MQDPNPRYTKAPPTPVAAGDRMIAVARSGGESYAIADGQIVCPRHGARFKARFRLRSSGCSPRASWPMPCRPLEVLRSPNARYAQLLQNLFALGAVPGHVGDLEEHVQAQGDDQLPGRKDSAEPALPRSACAAPLPERRGALHRL